MADKKFAGINGTVDTAEVNADYESAVVFDKVRVGKLGVFYRDMLKIKFMAYDKLERVFIRVQEVNGKLCCGTANFEYYRLVFVVNGKEIGDVISENAKATDDALACIAKNAPNVKIGFVKEQE